jgi:hypothetical protein
MTSIEIAINNLSSQNCNEGEKFYNISFNWKTYKQSIVTKCLTNLSFDCILLILFQVTSLTQPKLMLVTNFYLCK